jgi:D-serine deaminase-like pyridoxal phosphate-dependent protein
MPVSELQRAAIGRRRGEVETPALILDLDVARANITAMGERMAAMPAGLRPHTKLHKSPRIAQMQIDAGAVGVSTATAWEAIAMAEAGIPNILVASQVVGPGKVRALAHAARGNTITVAVDSTANLDQLSAAARAASSTIGVIVEVDVGMGRCGVRSKEEALEVARHALGLPGIEWRGAMGYEGHCMLEPDRDVRVAKQGQAMGELLEVVDYLAAHGIDCEVVSAGGTGTYDLTGANPRVTELQAGSYVFMDAFHGSLIPGFPVSLTVLSTVMSRHGTRVILDAGRKAVGVDLMMPEVVGHRAVTAFVNEEHTGIDVAAECSLAIGDTVELLPGYGPTTVNLHAIYHVVESDIVTDVWPVLARYGSDTAIEKGVAPRV